VHSYEEALQIVLEQTPAGKPQVLNEPLIARFDSPRFDNSAVDGFAVRAIDTAHPPVSLRIVESIEAGSTPSGPVGINEAARIMTGAPLPPGADSVVMQEDCRWDEEQVTVWVTAAKGKHIRRKGEEYREGETLLPAATAITPQVVALLAANGAYRPTSPIAVMVLGTGNELGAQGEALKDGQVYDSNSHAIEQALYELGLGKIHRSTLPDDSKAIERLLKAMLPQQDIVISIGGVSVGDKDLVRDVFARVGVKSFVYRVSIKPGKPFFFGKLDDKLVFGLPGNPVSALVCFYLFVRPAVLKMRGAPFEEPRVHATLKGSIEGGDRYEFQRGRCQDGVVESLEAQGSHQLACLAQANCLIHVHEGACLKNGDKVRITPLDWGG